MNKTIRYLAAIFKQTARNLGQTWTTQTMALLTVSLSVLIFSFFFLVYTNMLAAGKGIAEDIQLVVYFDNDLTPELVAQLKKKIQAFEPVSRIDYVTREQAFRRLQHRLGSAADILDDLDADFLPPSLEITPRNTLKSLADLTQFADFLEKIPGATKVQSGKEWLRRFSSFMHLLRIITILSAILLVLTTTFMIGYTIRLTVITRKNELKILRLLGASNGYLKMPLLLEGLLQGALGAGTGLAALYLLYCWIKEEFSGPGLLQLLDVSFFPLSFQVAIFAVSILLCAGGSMIAIRNFLRI